MVELSVEGRLIKLREMADEYAQLLEMEKPIDHGSVDIVCGSATTIYGRERYFRPC